MLLKVTSFHIYSHQDNLTNTIENCNICDLAIQNQSSEFTFVAILTLVSFLLFNSIDKKITLLVSEVSSFYLQFSFFGRPPPYVG